MKRLLVFTFKRYFSLFPVKHGGKFCTSIFTLFFFFIVDIFLQPGFK